MHYWLRLWLHEIILSDSREEQGSDVVEVGNLTRSGLVVGNTAGDGAFFCSFARLQVGMAISNRARGNGM